MSNLKDIQQIQSLIAKGKGMGYLTFDEVNKALPVEMNTPEQFEEIIGIFDQLEIAIVDLEKDGNLMIYGHMMYDETMFGPLRKYRDAAFFKENNVLRWEDRNGEHFYKFVAGLILPDTADDTEYIDFRQWLNEQDAETTQRMLEIVEENAYIFQPDIMRDGSEKYLFLMTCTNNGANRLLLVAERMD